MRLTRIICLVAVTSLCLVQAAKTYSYLALPDPSASSLREMAHNDFHWQGAVAPPSAFPISSIRHIATATYVAWCLSQTQNRHHVRDSMVGNHWNRRVAQR